MKTLVYLFCLLSLSSTAYSYSEILDLGRRKQIVGNISGTGFTNVQLRQDFHMISILATPDTTWIAKRLCEELGANEGEFVTTQSGAQGVRINENGQVSFEKSIEGLRSVLVSVECY